jgi:hypothetical protein
MAERSDGWLIALVVAVVGFAGVIGGAAINSYFNHLDKAADVDTKMIELSVGILRAEATDQTRPLRQWAIDVIENRANFKFNDQQKSALLNQALPYKGPSFSPSFSSAPLGMP